ncbi:YlxQ-related RNA-binding protein [Lactobacillus sp. S2-2]|uniref:YlxQ-related RNA-binding protein n=1 Tax=Lactobacillus sp. S2-2 TaxID=2692917 RepID=UPI001F187099|nr:YlxQ-related RNA-binding protein [Lactobacillus sp. S2-2]MCF6514951.1 YlxQ-related RNA-binding protein [Lactobacillus sp. S2-2]
MINYNKILNLLGISKRAGKIITGEDLILKAIRNNEVKLLFIANDAGKSTAKKFKDKTNFYEIPLITIFNKEQLGEAVGMPRVMIGITDAGFAKKFKNLNNSE